MHFELLHLHKRKRKRPDKKIHLLDNVVLLVAVIYPLTTIPQILEIWVNKNVQGVSLLTWLSFLILQAVLFFYGVVHKDKKLTLMWGLWILMYIFIVIGLLLYQ